MYSRINRKTQICEGEEVAVCCNLLQSVGECCDGFICKYSGTWVRVGEGVAVAAVCCSILQWVAVGCKMLQRAAVDLFVFTVGLGFVKARALQLLRYVTVCCSVLQCAAVCCSVL